MKHDNIAYLAGIIDGEGCISAGRVKPSTANAFATFTLRLSVGNTSPELMDWLLAACGGRVEEQKRRGKRRRQWRWWASSTAEAVELLRLCLPYLIIKPRQAGLFIELAELRKQSTGHKRKSPARQAEIVAEIQKLNQRKHEGQQIDVGCCIVDK